MTEQLEAADVEAEARRRELVEKARSADQLQAELKACVLERRRHDDGLRDLQEQHARRSRELADKVSRAQAAANEALRARARLIAEFVPAELGMQRARLEAAMNTERMNMHPHESDVAALKSQIAAEERQGSDATRIRELKAQLADRSINLERARKGYDVAAAEYARVDADYQAAVRAALA